MVTFENYKLVVPCVIGGQKGAQGGGNTNCGHGISSVLLFFIRVKWLHQSGREIILYCGNTPQSHSIRH